MSSETTTPITFHSENEIAENLNKLIQKSNLSKTYLINRALANYYKMTNIPDELIDKYSKEYPKEMLSCNELKKGK